MATVNDAINLPQLDKILFDPNIKSLNKRVDSGFEDNIVINAPNFPEFTEPPVIELDQSFSPIITIKTERVPKVKTVTTTKILTREINSPVLTSEEIFKKRLNEIVTNNIDYDYTEEDDKVKEACLEIFITKFKILNDNYPEKKIECPKEMTIKNINRIHKEYHNHIKNIFVESNIDYVEILYLVSVAVLEVVAVRIFDLPMSGFTKSEYKRFIKYRTMFIELGHEVIPYGSAQFPIKHRMIFTFVFNIIVFIVGKVILKKFLGNDNSDGFVDVIRDFIDKLKEPSVSMEDVEEGPKKIDEIKKMKKDSDAGINLEQLGINGDNIMGIIANMVSVYTSSGQKTPKKGSSYTFES